MCENEKIYLCKIISINEFSVRIYFNVNSNYLSRELWYNIRVFINTIHMYRIVIKLIIL